MNASFMETHNVALGLVPVDLNDGANTGLRIGLKNGERVTFIVAMGDSTAGVTNLTLNQADAVSGGNTKVLSVANPYYYKVGFAAAAFTRVVPTVAASNFVPTAFAGDPGLLVFEVLAEDLDVEGGYAWAYLSLADATAAKLGSVVAIVSGPAYLPAYATTV
jgi:hypothetical protein